MRRYATKLTASIMHHTAKGVTPPMEHRNDSYLREGGRGEGGGREGGRGKGGEGEREG